MKIQKNLVLTMYRFAFVLLALGLGLPTEAANAWQKAQLLIGPEAVWRPAEGEWEEIHEHCARDVKADVSCIATRMLKAGASPAAVAFAKSMNGEFYLSSFKEVGVVDLAEMTGPVLNDPETTENILVNGTPKIVNLWHHVKNINIKKNSNYRVIAKQFPKAQIWPMHRFDAMELLPQGGQRFIFSFVLLNGCRACEVAGSAVLAFDFDTQGKFQGCRLLRLSREKIL